MADNKIAVEVALRATTREYQKAMADAAAATKKFVGQLNETRFQQFNRGLANLQKGALAIAGATVGLQQAVAEIARAGIAFQRINQILVTATGTATQARAEYLFLAQTADRLGLSLEQTANSYGKFLISARAAGLETEKVRQVFVALARTGQATGASTDELGRAMTAFEQILAKGYVQAEELTGQLAEAIPVALKFMADGLNTTVGGLREMTESGLEAERALLAFAEGARRALGDTVEETEGAQAAFNRLSNAVFELKASLAEAGIIDALAALAEGLGESAETAKFLVDELDNVGTAGVSAISNIIDFAVPFRDITDRLARSWQLLGQQARAAAAEQAKAAEDAAEAERKALAGAQERARIQSQIAEQDGKIAELQKQRATEVARIRTDISKKTATSLIADLNEQIQEQRKALKAGIDAELDYAETIKRLRGELQTDAENDQRAIAAIRRRGLSERQAQADIEKQIAGQTQESFLLLRQGEIEQARLVARQAREQADQLQDVEKAEKVYRNTAYVIRQSKLLEIDATEKAANAQKEANKENIDQIAALELELEALQARFDKFFADPKVVKIDADISAAEEQINRLEERLRRLEEGTVLVRVNRAGGGAIPGLAGGGTLSPGLIRGPGTGTSDSILARVSSGEHAFVTKASRARKLWPLLNALNFGTDSLVNQVLSSLPPGLTRKQAPMPVAGAYAGGGTVQGGMQPVNIVLPGSSRPAATLFGEREQVQAFGDALARWSRSYTG